MGKNSLYTCKCCQPLTRICAGWQVHTIGMGQAQVACAENNCPAQQPFQHTDQTKYRLCSQGGVVEYPAGLSRNQKRWCRQYQQQLDATCTEPENEPKSEVILDRDMFNVALFEVGMSQKEAEPAEMDQPISMHTRSHSPSPTKATSVKPVSLKKEKTVAFPTVEITSQHMYEPPNVPISDLYVSQGKIDRNWREADRLMTRRRDWWNVKWAGRKKNVNEKQ